MRAWDHASPSRTRCTRPLDHATRLLPERICFSTRSLANALQFSRITLAFGCTPRSSATLADTVAPSAWRGVSVLSDPLLYKWQRQPRERLPCRSTNSETRRCPTTALTSTSGSGS